MKNRIAVIDCLKLYYALVICIFHIFEDTRIHMQGAGSGVEFFVLTAGFFFFQGWFKKREKLSGDEKNLEYPVSCLKSRILRFLPYTTIGMILDLIIVYLIIPLISGKPYSLGFYCHLFLRKIWDFSLLSMNGLNRNSGVLDGPLWTISAMIIAEFIINCLLVIDEKKYVNILLPLSLLFGYGYYANLDDTSHFIFRGFTTFGVIRVYLLYCISLYIYIYSGKIQKMCLSSKNVKLNEIIASLIAMMCQIAFLVMAEYENSRYGRWFATLLFTISLTVTFSGIGVIEKNLKQTKITNFMGELSMMIYIFHYPILKFFKAIWDCDKCYENIVPIMLIVLIASLVFMLFCKFMSVCVSKLYTNFGLRKNP